MNKTEQRKLKQAERRAYLAEKVQVQAELLKAKHENKARWKAMKAEKQAQRFLLLKGELDIAKQGFIEEVNELGFELDDRKYHGKLAIKQELKAIKKQRLVDLKQEIKAYKVQRIKELKAELKERKKEIRKKYK